MPDILSAVVWMEDPEFWKPPCDRDGDDPPQQEDRESVDAFGFTHQLTSAVSICPDAWLVSVSCRLYDQFNTDECDFILKLND